MTLVSICIPTHSARRLPYLREAVASARAQTHAELEIVLSDNGHDEAIAAFASEQQRLDSRIRYRRNEPSLSLGGNFNAALQSASGQYVLFNGDDDRLLPGCVERLLAAYGPDTVVAFSNHYIIDRDGERSDALTRLYVAQYGRDKLPAGRVADPVASAWLNSVPIPASLIRTPDAKRLGISAETTACDVDLFIRLANEGGSFVFVPDYLTEYRVHSGSTTSAGALVKPMLASLTEIQAPPHVEPLKRRLIGDSLLAAVSASLKQGDVESARALIRNRYYPSFRENPAYVVMHRALASLPSSLARRSSAWASRARRAARSRAGFARLA